MKRLLIAGYGDIAHRTAALLAQGIEVRAVSRRRGFDLDRVESLASLAGWPDAVLYCAPPPAEGSTDPRTANLLKVLASGGILPSRLVYIGTSGVYGDCAGAEVDETRPLNPQTARAVRRADAEQQFTDWGRKHGSAVVLLRAPGIYASDRLPLRRLQQKTPVLADKDDVYTNHIHAEDLAGIAFAALCDAAPAGAYNASDDTRMKMGDWFDLLADRSGLPRPRRVLRAEAAREIPQALRSFMGESRRLLNRKMKEQLGVRLRYPTVHDGVPVQQAAA